MSTLNELVKQVLNIKTKIESTKKTEKLILWNYGKGSLGDNISKCSFAHKCKEWAILNGYSLRTIPSNTFGTIEWEMLVFHANTNSDTGMRFSLQNNEHDLIINVCEYIIEFEMKNTILKKEKIMNTTKSPALIYAEEHSFDHDISHCNPVEKTENCYSCKRYAAHLQVGINEEKFRDGLYSYFSEPQSSCIDKDYKHFIDIGKKK